MNSRAGGAGAHAARIAVQYRYAEEERLRTLIETMQVGVLLFWADGTIAEHNRAALRLLGVTAEQLRAGSAERQVDVVFEDGRPVSVEDYPVARVLRTGDPVCGVVLGIRRPDSCERTWLITDAVPQRRPDGSIEQVLCTFTDVTEHRRTEQDLWESEQRFRSAFMNAPIGMALIGIDGRFLRVNRILCEMLGYANKELMATTVQALNHPDDVASGLAFMESVRAGTADSFQMERRYIHKRGHVVYALLNSSVVRDALGKPLYLISQMQDITERKEVEKALERQALHDILTDLPNRTLLLDRLQQAILAAHREERPVALVVMDLDRFKEINDTFGHQHGDLVLQQVARRLQAVLWETDTVARLGGDEFALVLPDADDPGSIIVARKVQRALADAIVVHDQHFDVSASIGIALYPEHGSDVGTLLRRADVAMYVAKRSNSDYAVYAAEQDQYSPDRLALIRDLRYAIEQDQLLLHYQPKVDLKSGRVEHVEALARWQHPERGLVPPDQFVSLAEHTGLIKPLSRWVLDHALQQCGEWRRAGIDLAVAVNISAHNLLDDDLPAAIAALLRTSDIPPERLVIEITESGVMADVTRAMSILGDINGTGVGISIDDFGTGYSSLAYLTRLPVDETKIDKSFVLHMADKGEDAVIVRSVIELGHSLGLQVVAEGVENQETWDLLGAMGCDLAQGYYLSRPMPPADLIAWLQSYRLDPSG